MSGPRKHTDDNAQSADAPNAIAPTTIALVGMMGVGKTTIGRRLAPRLGLPFFDADAEIEQAAGMTVSDLFRMHGEKSFREGEARVIARLLEGPPMVLATGGGALTTPATRDLIKTHALSIWIKADMDTIMRRATRRGTRPLLQTGNPRETIERLMKEREAYYAAADIHVDTQPGPHINTVNLILDALEQRQAHYRAHYEEGSEDGNDAS